MGLGFFLSAAPPASAYTLEAERVLEALQEKLATGLAAEADYADFLSNLQDGDGCETWAENPLGQTAEVWEEMVEACPDLEPSADGQAVGARERAHFAASQTVQPRRPGPPQPYFLGKGRNDRGSFALSWKEDRLYNRRVEATLGGFSLQAGHVHAYLDRTGLGFVAGSRFYAGWSGGSGFSGPLDSPQSSLDGLGLGYGHGHLRLEIAGAWNRLEPRGARIVPDRRDAIFHSLGLTYRALRIQAVHQRFEPFEPFEHYGGRPLDVAVGGLALMDPRDRWHVGGAISSVDSGRGWAAPGGYGEIAWGSREASRPTGSGYGDGAEAGEKPADAESREKHAGYRLEAHQADPAWANPLQSPQGYRQDTLDGQWILPGRGEGGFSARSRLTVFGRGRACEKGGSSDSAERGGYRADLESGGEAAWILGEEGLLAARTRLALIQSLGAWTYTVGTGLQNSRGRGAVTPAIIQEGSSGIGQILAWRNAAWRARLSLTGRGEGYRGPYPNPLALLLERREGRRHCLGAEAFTGDIRDPAGYLRLVLKQEWEMGSGATLRHSLRLPWSRGSGWAGDLGYQVVLEASL